MSTTTDVAHLRDFRPDQDNARLHDERNLAAIETSMQTTGFGRPILAAKDGTVLAGNATLEAAGNIGMEEVILVHSDGTKPIIHVRTDLDPNSEMARLAAFYDNRTAELASWDTEVLAALMQEVDIAAVAMTPEEAADLIAADGTGQGTEGLTDPDEVPEPPVEPTTRPGDVWRLGEHRVGCFDATQAENVARLLGGATIGLLLTDPPYNVGFSYKGEFAGQDDRPPAEYGAWLRRALDAVTPHLETGAPVFVWQGMLNVQHFASWFGDKEWRIFAACKNFVQARPTWLQYAWDPVVCWTHGPSTAKNHVGVRDWHVAVTSNTAPTDDRRISGEHPCPRPVDTVVFLMEAHSATGAVAYDPFLGSGTTLIAAEQTGRRCYGTEIDPAYCDVIIRRWEAFTGGTAELERAP